MQLYQYLVHGYVTLHHWPHVFSQTQALNDCVQRYRSFSDWMTFIDVDEFYFDNYATHAQFDLIERANSIVDKRNVSCAYIEQQVFCKRNALTRTNEPIYKRFPSLMNYARRHKPLFRADVPATATVAGEPAIFVAPA